MIHFIESGRHRFGILCIVSFIVCLASNSSAQEKSGGADEFQLEEIFVNAERRTANLQNTSIAATAIQGYDLDDKAVVNFVDLQFAAPGITIADGLLSKSVNIRGIGLASGSPAVTK